MLVITADVVRDILSVKSCMNVMERALTDLANGQALQVLRTVLPLEGENVLGQMPSYLKNDGVIGTKVITVYPDNNQIGFPSHQGVVLLFNAINGKLQAIVDGNEITAIRTAAVSSIATDLLANKNSHTLSILGTGEQARSHLEAMLLVRPIKYVRVWSRHRKNGLAFKEEMEAKLNISVDVSDSAEEAVHQADIICTVTAAREPILKGEWVKEGAHINAVGACKANDRELATDLVKKSEFYVDRVESATKESGDFLIPLQEGVINESHIKGEIGELLIGKIPGRKSEKSITIFNSLGLAIEDIAAANFIYKEMSKKNEVSNY
ncbi:ornithine cyclodeaminase family protein [Lederbergia panacisoli]|uniref:ornithine cyclodeaminase family protein n=1 Tax=Lederbergia panacisoli TaxID=1255251 RepID=UPI00214C7E8F|nr:ornithine cyclodeaminase family protein [Lederbergia panacisoli]MCR2820080.1 ornithine cyclodeaminase family protein [Lederbergia panacisoli]